MRQCEVSGCERLGQCDAGGEWVCVMHYKRWKRHGDTATKLRNYRPGEPYEACRADGCSAQEYQRTGYCRKHHERVRRHGHPDVIKVPDRSRAPRGPEHHHWSTTPTYAAVHLRLRSRRGPARAHTCACGAQARHWSYTGRDPGELVSPEGLAFTANLDAYTPRCVRCHKRHDMALRNG